MGLASPASRAAAPAGTLPATSRSSVWLARRAAAWVLPLVITAAALALRSVALTAKSLWFDETFSVFLAGQPLRRLLLLVPANDPHPPLYYVSLHFWMAVFGDGEVAVRALSVLISTLVVVVTWRFGRRLVGSTGALVAAALVAVAPSQVATAQEARMYGLLALVSLVSWWALHRAVAGGRPRDWALYAVTTATMFYVHYFAFLVWLAQVAYLLWRRSTRGVWRPWVSASLAAGLLFLPWLPAFLDQVAGGRAWPTFRPPLQWAIPLETLWGMTLGGMIVNAAGLGGWTLHAVPFAAVSLLGGAGVGVLLVALFLRGTVAPATKQLLVCAVAVPVGVAFLFSLWLNVFSPRYFPFVTPPIALLLGGGVSAVTSRRGRWTVPAAAVLVVVVLVPNAIGLEGFYRRPRLDVFDWRRIASVMTAEARRDDAIVFLPGFSRIPVNYYFRGPQLRLALTPAGTDVVGDGHLTMTSVVTLLTRHPRVWILTVPPIPEAVRVLTGALGEHDYAIRKQGRINMARLILLERGESK